MPGLYESLVACLKGWHAGVRMLDLVNKSARQSSSSFLLHTFGVCWWWSFVWRRSNQVYKADDEDQEESETMTLVANLWLCMVSGEGYGDGDDEEKMC